MLDLMITAAALFGAPQMDEHAFPTALPSSAERIIPAESQEIPSILREAYVEIPMKMGCKAGVGQFTKDNLFGYILRFKCNNEKERTLLVIWADDNLQYSIGTYVEE